MNRTNADVDGRVVGGEAGGVVGGEAGRVDGGVDAARRWPDAEVISRSWADPERFADLFDRHAPHIHRYLARRLGQQIAMDLVAETFLVAFQKRQSYDTPRISARPWLYGIATNLVSQYRRDEVREYRLRLVAVPERYESFPDDLVADRVAAARMRPELTDALSELTPPDRDVLLLIAWEQLTYEEVAVALDIPVGTVRSRLNRVRRQLRTRLHSPFAQTQAGEQ